MMERREPPSLTDYLLVGINPALIMLLVGSLVFFLLEALYVGQYDGRLRLIFGLFVMAIVCISRISINEGKGHATLFAIPLAFVTAIAMSRFVDYAGALAPFKTVLNWGLMGLVWWAAHQLTWDCTVIDEAADASGAGLFRQLGWSGGDAAARSDSARASGPVIDEPEGLTSHDEPPPPPDEGLWTKLRQRLLRKHTPGVWVVYFSLAALPIFGIGQGFISGQDAEGRARSHTYLAVYVGSGLALLVSTSFLNLRRYLRKRRVEVSDALTFRWLTVGAILVLAVVVVSWMMPGPGMLEWANPIAFSQQLSPSKWGWGQDGPQANQGVPANVPQQNNSPQPGGHEGGGQSGGQQGGGQQGGAPSGGQPAGNPSQGSSSSDAKPSGGQQAGGQQPSGQSPGGSPQGSPPQGSPPQGSQAQGGQAQGGQSSAGQSPAGQSPTNANQPGQPSQGQNPPGSPPTTPAQPPTSAGPTNSPTASNPNASSPPSPHNPPADAEGGSTASSGGASSLGKMVESVTSGLAWLWRLAAVVALLVAAWLFRESLWRGIRDFWAGLRNWLDSLSGRPSRVQADVDAAAVAAALKPPPSWQEFSDPFASGLSQRVPTGELVRYTFAALDAWGRDGGRPRGIQETPLEYAGRLAAWDEQLGRDARLVAEYYGHLAYARTALPREAADAARRLWQRLANLSKPAAVV